MEIDRASPTSLQRIPTVLLDFPKFFSSPAMSVYGYTLQIEKYGESIKKMVDKTQTTIIKGPTGCGKSTFVPLLFKEHKVAIIEPRRIAVNAIYNILAPHIPGLGYKMRFSKKVSEETRSIVYTDGSFLHDIEDAGEFEYIIVDEVHERSERTDILLGILRKTYKNKLILMSATLDTTKLERYFGARVYEIPGHSHPLTVKYLDKPTGDYISEAYLTIRNILNTREEGENKDILVFLPGEEDINELYQLCRRIPSISICKVYSAMSDEDQQLVYRTSTLTRVILSTNICETSITIPNVKYVVDTGLCKMRIYDGVYNFGIVPASRESATQRAGRCNRLGPGVCYRLYTEFEPLPKAVIALQRTDLSGPILTLANLGSNFLDFPFLDFPSIGSSVSALMFLLGKQLIVLKFHSGNGKYAEIDALADAVQRGEIVDLPEIRKRINIRVTKYGRRVAQHPFDPHLAHFYEQCIEAKIGYYASLVLSMLSQENFTFMSPEPKTQPDIPHLLDLMSGYLEAPDRAKYAKEKCVPLKGMEIARRMLSSLNKSRDGDPSLLERVFSSCFSHNLCEREEDGSYRMLRNGMQVYVHPSSMFFKRKEKRIVLVDVFCTTKRYARIVGSYIDEPAKA